MAVWFKTVLVFVVIVVVLAGAAMAVLHIVRTPRFPSDILPRTSFRCMAVSESFRTVAASRIKRKSRQISRIERLLNIDNLEPLDSAKLHSELAILHWELEDSRFTRDCAEAYYEPGSTQMRKTFLEAPRQPNYQTARKVLEETNRAVSARMLPRGYSSRSQLYLATAALSDQDFDEAITAANGYLDESPDGLYADSLKLVIADAKVQNGAVDEALNIYREVGKLRIGLDAHYARYRTGVILRANGSVDEGESHLNDVRKWADRGDRQALGRYLKGDEPRPPRPRKASR